MTPRPWSLVVLAVGCTLALLLAAGCSPRAPDTAADELLFALPSWCGRQGPRRPWTAWAVERSQAGGTGVCGVRLPGASPDDAGGVCLELVDHRVARAEVRSGRSRAPIDPAAVGATWVTVPEHPEAILVRVEGAVVQARSSGGQAAEGPCFLR